MKGDSILVIGGATVGVVPFTPAVIDRALDVENGREDDSPATGFILLICVCEEESVLCSGCSVVVSGTAGVCPLREAAAAEDILDSVQLSCFDLWW